MKKVILGEKPWLLDDCLNKWSFASKIKGMYVSSCNHVGDDFRGNMSYEMNYLVVNREIIGCQVSESGAIIDFVTRKYLIEVKNWGWEAESERERVNNLNHLIDQMKGYNIAQDTKYSDRKIVIFFYKEIPEDVIGDESKGLISELLKIFQDKRKFEIVNGIREISKLG